MEKRVLIGLLVACVLLVSVERVLGEDYYEILGVPKDASPKQIKKAFNTLAGVWHPDRKSDPKEKEEANVKYQAISAAYKTLSDETKRKNYDQYGEKGAPQHGHDMHDFWPFGGGHRQQHRETEKKGESLTIDLSVSLEDLYNERTLTVTHQKQTLCPICRGSGAKDPNDVQQCSVCKGSGVKTVTQRFGPGLMTQTQTTCDKCNGKGKIMKSVCPSCKASKVAVGQDTVTVVIEKGMVDGQTIVFDSEADQNPGETPGDLIFRIVTLPHSRFVRNGNDLHHKMTISLLESLVGFSKQIRHLDGHTVTVARQDVTKPGLVMTIEGEGMPIYDQGSFGRLLVEFTVRFPKSLTAEQKDAVRKYLA
eukprot:TRINITY_DN7142_c0_g1_i1.p1 TRINITY_DN7142_c0_g1~~TRINITY_DN7142_c0_g1_i1.p1  ORF type:complete len:375 (-),score=93.57 TRINITY_DN7142_c0_g1_i1:69-1160(-)